MSNKVMTSNISAFKPLSVYKGEVPIIELAAEKGAPCKLWMKKGVLSLEGNAELGAKLMFEYFLKENLDSFGIIKGMRDEISSLKAALRPKSEPFDITQHEWSDNRISFALDDDGLLVEIEGDFYECAKIDKQDGIAIAKALGVTAEDLK